jgi:hypothetical protein
MYYNNPNSSRQNMAQLSIVALVTHTIVTYALIVISYEDLERLGKKTVAIPKGRALLPRLSQNSSHDFR